MNRKLLVFGILSILILMSFQTSLGLNTKIDVETTVKIETQNITDDKYTTNLPPSFSWRDKDGVDYVTPIRDQRPFHSCETFALVAAVETMVQYKVDYPFGCDLSEAHLFFYSGGNMDWGSYPENDTRFLKEYGVPDEACWPYPKEKRQYPLNTTCPNWQNRTVKIRNWSYLPQNVDAIKDAVFNNGPVPTYMHVYTDFRYYKRGIYRHIWGESVAVHLVTIVGYNDDPGYWICKNSWGKGWGDDGWFKIKYGECSIERMAFYLEDVYGVFPIIYVDDDNIDGPWDGTIDHPYRYIQDGIDNAYDLYTVFVRNGTYQENIVINKTINLDGEDKTNTFIDGSNSGDVIYITMPDVRVSGFTIRNSGGNLLDAGIKTLTLDSNATISTNIIQNNDVGIYLNFAYPLSGNIVEDNIIQHNRDGIFILWADNNQIEDNYIINNSGDGIEMERSQQSILKGNKIANNSVCGIYLRAASNRSIIQGNNILNNDIGIELDNSNRNKIWMNNLVDNQKQATFTNSFLNRWCRNHWSDWLRIIPRGIKGTIGPGFPWRNFDWLPNKYPYEI